MERSRAVCEEGEVGKARGGDWKMERAVERSPVPWAMRPER